MLKIINQFWDSPQKILIILAHPDDPEFFLGGTIAKWILEGHIVSYCLLTRGEKGINEEFCDRDVNFIKNLRSEEQERAAGILGVNDIFFYDNPDGYLFPDLLVRRQIVRTVRIKQPDIVVSCDPTNYFIRDDYINHPDHRAAGQAVVDSVFPAAQNISFFPDLLIKEGLKPHHAKEVWLALPAQVNVIVDITNVWEIKLRALHEHKSQIGDISQFDERMKSQRSVESTPEAPRYEETFHRIIFRK